MAQTVTTTPPYDRRKLRVDYLRTMARICRERGWLAQAARHDRSADFLAKHWGLDVQA